MDFDFNSIVNMAVMAEAYKKSPQSAKLLNVFLKRGISLTDTLAILLEMTTLVKEMKEGTKTDNE